MFTRLKLSSMKLKHDHCLIEEIKERDDIINFTSDPTVNY